MNLYEDINYWMSKCATLQQEVDVLNEKLTNASVIKWQTGRPKEEGKYLVNYTDGSIGVADNNFWKWQYFKDKVTAWCPISEIEPYKEETK